jgi:hypothetical protein
MTYVSRYILADILLYGRTFPAHVTSGGHFRAHVTSGGHFSSVVRLTASQVAGVWRVTGSCFTVPRPRASRFRWAENSRSSFFSSSERLLQYLHTPFEAQYRDALKCQRYLVNIENFQLSIYPSIFHTSRGIF